MLYGNVSHNGHCELEFIETSAIRFEDIKIDIAGIQTERELLDLLSHKKQSLRKNIIRIHWYRSISRNWSNASLMRG